MRILCPPPTPLSLNEVVHADEFHSTSLPAVMYDIGTILVRRFFREPTGLTLGNFPRLHHDLGNAGSRFMCVRRDFEDVHNNPESRQPVTSNVYKSVMAS